MHEMDAGGFNPDWCIAPGVTIKAIVEGRKLETKQVLVGLGLSKEQYADLLVGRRPIDLHLAGRLAITLGSTQGFWMRREKTYRDGIRRGLVDAT